MLYLDASALVKLHVREAGTELARAAVEAALARRHLIATCCVSYAEVLAAFARAVKDSDDLNALNADFLRTWPQLHAVFLDQPLLTEAGILARTHRLRGFDALHLAAALSLRKPRTKGTFAVFDRTLGRAAEAEGFHIVGS